MFGATSLPGQLVGSPSTSLQHHNTFSSNLCANRKHKPRRCSLEFQVCNWIGYYLLTCRPHPDNPIASQELQDQFNALQADSSTFGLLANINKEALVPLTTIPSTSSSFEANLANLTPHLKPDAALYIILRRYDTAPYFLAITYIPDSAPVRQKMLFASTRLTFVRELGTEHFRETIFTTDPEELTESGFKKHEAHNNLAAPLTEEEQTLGEVKRAEQAAGSGTGTREIHLSKNLNMPVDTNAIEAMKEIGQEGGRVVTMLVSGHQFYSPFALSGA